MSEIELKNAEEELYEKYENDLNNIRLKYVKANAEFKIGQFIQNVTGIIKIEKIGYSLLLNSIRIEYKGFRYKKTNGKLSRTKDKKLSILIYDLKRIYED